MSAETVIPDKFVELARKVASLAAEAQLNGIMVTIQPGYHDQWRDTITVYWDSGRHGDGRNNLVLSSTVMVSTQVKP